MKSFTRFESRLPSIIRKLKVAEEEIKEEAAKRVMEAAKEKVPVKTGRLKDAIHVEHEPEGVYVVAGNTKAWYGHLVERGTSHSAPHPFLIPAFEENKNAARVNAARLIAKASH